MDPNPGRFLPGKSPLLLVRNDEKLGLGYGFMVFQPGVAPGFCFLLGQCACQVLMRMKWDAILLFLKSGCKRAISHLFNTESPLACWKRKFGACTSIQSAVFPVLPSRQGGGEVNAEIWGNWR